MNRTQLSRESGAAALTTELPAAPAASGCRSREILGLRVDATSYDETTDAIVTLAVAGVGGAICVSTVHMVMEAFDDPEFRQIVNAADRVTPVDDPLGLLVYGFLQLIREPDVERTRQTIRIIGERAGLYAEILRRW